MIIQRIQQIQQSTTTTIIKTTMIWYNRQLFFNPSINQSTNQPTDFNPNSSTTEPLLRSVQYLWYTHHFYLIITLNNLNKTHQILTKKTKFQFPPCHPIIPPYTIIPKTDHSISTHQFYQNCEPFFFHLSILSYFSFFHLLWVWIHFFWTSLTSLL